MKKFLMKISCLLIIIYVSSLVLDKTYTQLYLRKVPRSKASYLIQNKVKDVDYIFLGSSRVHNHVNTKLIEELTGKKAVNLGVQGATLNDYELFLRLLIENNVKFEKVFMQIDYVFNFTDFSDVSGTDVIPYINQIKAVDEHLKRYNKNYMTYKYIPFYRFASNDFKLGFREAFMLLSNRKPRINFENGFDPKFTVGKNLRSSLPGEIVGENKIFSRIDSIAKSNKIDITYFMAPFCENTKNIDYGQKLEKKIFNFKNYSQSISDNKYFFNCSHLNIDGANLFTEILVKDLKL